MTNIKRIQQEDETAIRQDPQDMQDGRCDQMIATRQTKEDGNAA
jgi:hypothetical protein